MQVLIQNFKYVSNKLLNMLLKNSFLLIIVTNLLKLYHKQLISYKLNLLARNLISQINNIIILNENIAKNTIPKFYIKFVNS
jgi:hypothetical protein